jgi:two-component system, NarL family, nitrate/nitrite response regulator NarL
LASWRNHEVPLTDNRREIRSAPACWKYGAFPKRAQDGATMENAVTTLTDRERQIMRLVSEGLSNKEIGRRLNITDGTIKVHLHHIFQKLEISNRTVLAAFAISHNDRMHLAEDKPATPDGLD